MSFLSSSRCVCIFADEGLQIYNVGRLGAKFVDFVPWNTDDFQVSVRDIIVRKCKRKPVVIFNDMVEQHYRKERIPKVGVMDRANVLKRRLNVAFPNYKIRAALKLDEKKSHMPKDGKGGAYLFAAIPASEAFTKTIEAIRQSNAQIVGFYLLPVEASAMVKALSSKVSKGQGKKASWTIFMGQHQSGAVRQIVTRDGELALTRMTPIVDTDVEPELWAKEISGELSATMSYLSRFGYQDDDGLNVIVIGNDAVEPHIEDAIHIDCNLQVLTSQEAGQLLGVNVGLQNDLRYADPLHAAYLGRKSKYRLPMQASAIDGLTKPRQVASFIVMALLAATAYFGYHAFSAWSKSIEVEESLRVAEERKRSVKQEYDAELEKKKKIGFDFLLVNNSVEIFNGISQQKTEPLMLLREIGQSLGADMHLDELDVRAVNLKPRQGKSQNPYGYGTDSQGSVEKKEITITEAVMTFSFDSSVDPDLGVEKTNTLKDRIQSRLPNYDVSIIKQVADLSYTGNFVGESGTSGTQNGEPEDYVAEIIVGGQCDDESNWI